jgi:hypothetical protein
LCTVWQQQGSKQQSQQLPQLVQEPQLAQPALEPQLPQLAEPVGHGEQLLHGGHGVQVEQLLLQGAQVVQVGQLVHVVQEVHVVQVLQPEHELQPLVQGSAQQSSQVRSQTYLHLPGTQYCSTHHSPHFFCTVFIVQTGLQISRTHSLQRVSMQSL